MPDRTDELTKVLNGLDDNRPDVAAALPAVYDELRRLSARFLRSERANHTLEPTALVHEAFMSLANGRSGPWNDRTHFFRVAARTMRHILVNHAHARNALKRGGKRLRLSIEHAEAVATSKAASIVDAIGLDEALSRLNAFDERKASIVELRFFGGCSMPEIAELLDVSLSVVERDWRLARAWLHKELSAEGPTS